MTMGDLLTDLELCQVAGVGPESRGKYRRIANVLANADIYYWWKADGSIGTTWHHVHAAGTARPFKGKERSSEPNLSKVK